MIYYSVSSIIWVHLLLGVCFGVGSWAWAKYKEKSRVWFAFGGEVISLGDQHQWLKWYVVSFLFEIISTFLSGEKLYVELAMSFVEAAMIVAGAFLVDRFAMLVETGPTPPSSEVKIKDIGAAASEYVKNMTKHVNDTISQTNDEREERNQKQMQDFDDITRNN